MRFAGLFINILIIHPIFVYVLCNSNEAIDKNKIEIKIIRQKKVLGN